VPSTFAWLMGKRGLILTIALVASVVLALAGGLFRPAGFWDGPH
jgi:hypothetical protein